MFRRTVKGSLSAIGDHKGVLNTVSITLRDGAGGKAAGLERLICAGSQ